MVSKPEALGILQGEVAEASDADDSDALVRLGIGKREVRSTRCNRRRKSGGLLVAERSRDGHSGVSVGQHVLSVATLQA